MSITFAICHWGFGGPDPFSAVGPQTFLRAPHTNPRKNCQPPSRLQALFKSVVTSGSVATWVSVNFGVHPTIGLPIDNGQSFSWFGTHLFFGHHHIGSGCPSTNCGTETIKSATGCWMTIQPLCKHLGPWHVNWRFYFGKIAGIPYTAKHEFEIRGIKQWSNFRWLFFGREPYVQSEIFMWYLRFTMKHTINIYINLNPGINWVWFGYLNLTMTKKCQCQSFPGGSGHG